MLARTVVAGLASDERMRGWLRLTRVLVCAVAVIVLLLVVGSPAARAESLCTDTWVGPAEGSWETATDWSGGVVPSSSDTACIGAGKKVHVASGAQQAAIVQGEGTLEVWSGSLELASAFEASRVHSFVMYGGTLTGVGTLEVSGSFDWREEGTLAGTGALVIGSGASATAHKHVCTFCEYVLKRSLVNDGTFTEEADASIVVAEGVTVTNHGAFVGGEDELIVGSGAMSTFVNEGTVEKVGASSSTFRMEINFDNDGAVKVESGYFNVEAEGSSGSAASWLAATGSYVDFLKGKYTFTGGTWSGWIALNEPTIIDNTDIHAAKVEISNATTIEAGTLTVQSLTLENGVIAGPGNLKISSSFDWTGESKITGSGTTTLESGGTGEIVNNSFYVNYSMTIENHTFVNHGSIKLTGGAAHLVLNNKAFFKNYGTFTADRNIEGENSSRFINWGKLQKIADPWGNEETEVSAPVENYGTIKGNIDIKDPITVDRKTKRGKRNKLKLSALEANCGDPVNCQTGNFFETQTDIAVGGRGVGLSLTRTYNAQATAEGEHGAFGYGWTNSFGEHLTFNSEAHTVTVVQEEGATVTFTEEGGKLVAPAWTQAELAGGSETGYTLTASNQTVYRFSGAGRLESVTDRDGNKTGLSYNEKGELATITDPDGRTIKLAYNGEGLVESATDPMSRVVKYAYESGNLVSVTMPGESSPRWRFKYDGSHRMTSEKNALGGETKNTYNSENQVVSQTDPAGHTFKWEYEPFSTKITNEATGSVTLDEYTSEYQLSAITHGYGTEGASTETFTYNERGEPETTTDGDGHTTSYEYNEAGDKTVETDPEGHETKWAYNDHHQVTSETLPSGETTSIEYEEHGNPVKVSRPAPEEKTQVTHFEYNGVGELTAMIDPSEHKWSYGYDEAGDRTSETSPEGEKTTWSYNGDSQQTEQTTPRGNVEGGKPSEYTTSIERNAQGLATKVTEPEPTQGKPVNVVASGVSGVMLEKQVASAGVGVWEGASTLSYAYQWQRCNSTGGSCTSISGATKSTYTLASADVGHTLRVAVTATNLDGSAVSTSLASVLVGVAAPPVYASDFGGKGTGASELRFPYATAIDSHGDVWVSDTENERVDEYSSSGTFIKMFGWGVSNGEAKLQVCTSSCRAGTAGSGAGQFDEPAGITVSGSDVYVADFENARVERFTEAGEYLGAFGSKGTGAGQLKGPTGLAANSGGDIWVAEQESARLSEFTGTGSFVETVGFGVSNGEAKLQVCTTGCRAGTAGSGNGQLNEPEGITFDGSNLYVADMNNNRVQEFNEKREYVTKFGTKGTGDAQFEAPEDIAVASGGEDLYISDFGNDRVQELGSTGKYLAQFGVSGTGPGQLNSPTGLAVNSSGDVYVVDDGNNRVEEWKLAAAPVDLTAPVVSGKMVSGQSLSAGTGNWSGVPSPSYSDQWKRCNTSGESCTSIAGATSASYTLTSADAGHTIRVAVTASNTGGSSEALSPATPTMSGAHSTIYAYDADGNLESVTDPEGDKTTYVHNTEDQPTKVEEPDGASSETEYNGAGEVVAQINGDGHTTKYVRNVLGEITETSEPGARKTKDSYEPDGNLETVTLPSGHTTSYTYYTDGKLKKIVYSDGITPTVEYAYNAGGQLTSISDGTGTTSYTYNQLGELTKAKDGHGDTTGYEYNLGEQQTKITYPNGKSIEQTYDKDGRLHSITDWLSHTTTFAYNPNSDLTATKYPSGSEEEDTYSYDNSGQPTETRILKGTETLASLTYSRNNNEQVTAINSKGLPGSELEGDAYDANSRLTAAGGTTYKYDNAGNITQQAEASSKYNEAEQLETAGSTSYTYNTEGQRTKTIPATGPATTYSYNQAGNLTSINRPEEGATPKIEDTYTYSGENLRTSETIKGATNYLTWNTTQPLPLLLSNGTNSYIYGPEGAPIEQITSEEHAQYLHHDQQGSTRLITGEKGETLGSYAYTPYGTTQEHTGTTTTQLGYDGQYTTPDTGLIYLRARVYDPNTAQFLTVDPAVEVTHQPYAYAKGNPLTYTDRGGFSAEEIEIYCPWCVGAMPTPVAEAISESIKKSGEALLSLATEEANGDEGEAELRQREAQRKNCNQIPRGSKPPKAAYREIEKETGLSKGELSDALHRIKRGAGLPPTANTRIDSEGNVYDEDTGEWIGNIVDETSG
jgi:RHS repeat-associated protein